MVDQRLQRPRDGGDGVGVVVQVVAARSAAQLVVQLLVQVGVVVAVGHGSRSGDGVVEYRPGSSSGLPSSCLLLDETDRTQDGEEAVQKVLVGDADSTGQPGYVVRLLGESRQDAAGNPRGQDRPS